MLILVIQISIKSISTGGETSEAGYIGDKCDVTNVARERDFIQVDINSGKIEEKVFFGSPLILWINVQHGIGAILGLIGKEVRMRRRGGGGGPKEVERERNGRNEEEGECCESSGGNDGRLFFDG
jgi:hypothetical protein